MPDATLFSTSPTSAASADGAPSPQAEGAWRYADTRESGIPWLGSVPKHWTIDRLRWTIAGAQNGIWGDEPDGLNDIICVRVADFDRTTLTASIDDPTMRAVTPSERRGRVLQRGDLLLEKSGGGELQPVGAVVEYDHDAPAVCSNFVARVRVARGFDARFLVYLHSHLYTGRVNTRSIKQTTGIQNLDAMAYFDERVCWPPLPEQQAIAGWLDERTRRIDELVAAKRRLIDLLAEQRTALITHAVTKGLNPAAPMKPSGIDWLGSVPGHWEVKRIKFIARVGNGSTPSRENPEYWSGDYPWLNSGVVNQREVTEASDFVTQLALAECHLPIVRPPAVLVGITGEGKTRGMATVLRIEATINQHLSFVKPTRADCDTEYMRFTLHAAYQFLRDESGGGGSTKGAITCDQLGNVSIPFPPHPEQRAIVAHIDAACAKLDALTATTETAIARLTEYRQALISAAVTGKINVCGAAVSARADDALAADPAPAIAGRIGKNGAARTANKHFQRSVLAAEIIGRIGQHPTFGRVKLQKALILAEGHLQLAEIESQPVRAAAGPFDNAMMRSIQSQLQKSQWYEYKKDGTPLKFAALAKVGGHKQYFDRYWGAKEAAFAALMAVLARLTTRQAEIVATLYSAWNDFLIDNKPVTDDALVAEVLTNWDPAKTAIPEAKWRAALPWMGSRGLVPKGYGAHTRRTNSDRSKE